MNKDELIKELTHAAVLQTPDSKEEQYLIELAESLRNLPENQISKWIASNREGLSRFLPERTKLWKFANGPEPKWIDEPLDLSKMFNDEDILHTWQNRTDDQLKTVAEMNGISPERLKEELQKQSLIQSRKDNMWPEWAPGHSVMNPIMNLAQQVFTPRLYEKRLREGVDADLFTDDKGNFDPSLLLDIGENALYTVPYGKVAGSVVKPIGTMLTKTGIPGKLARTGMFLGENTANPFIMEVADDVAYDDPENERSNFSWTDVATGAGVNMGAPLLMKGSAAGLARIFSGSGKPDKGALKALYEYGEGGAEDVLREIRANNQKYDELMSKSLISKSDLDATERAFIENYPRYELNDNVLESIMTQDGKTFREKVGNYIKSLENSERKTLELADGPTTELKGQTILPVKKNLDGSISPIESKPTIVEKETQSLKAIPYEEKAKTASDKILPALENSPYIKLDDKSLKDNGQIIKENMVKNFFSNKYGDDVYDKNKTSSIPGIGVLINYLNEQDEKEREREAKEKALQDYRIKFMLGE